MLDWSNSSKDYSQNLNARDKFWLHFPNLYETFIQEQNTYINVFQIIDVFKCNLNEC
jgi:hypothetical protein